MGIGRATGVTDLPEVLRFIQAKTIKCESFSQLASIGQNSNILLGHKLERGKSVTSMPSDS